MYLHIYFQFSPGHAIQGLFLTADRKVRSQRFVVFKCRIYVLPAHLDERRIV